MCFDKDTHLSVFEYTKKPLNISCSSFHCHLSKHVVEIKCNWSIMIRKYFTCWELRAWNVALVSKMQPSYLAFQQTTTPSRFEAAITRFASFPTADKSMQNLWASLSSPLVFLITQDKRGATAMLAPPPSSLAIVDNEGQGRQTTRQSQECKHWDCIQGHQMDLDCYGHPDLYPSHYSPVCWG